MNGDDDERLDVFQAELDFWVDHLRIKRCSVVFAEGFSNEQTVVFVCPEDADIRRFQGSSWFVPSYVRFEDDGVVQCSAYFTSPSAGNDSYASFVEAIWELSLAGFVPDVKASSDVELARSFESQMTKLRDVQTSWELDITGFFGLVF